MLFDVFVFMAFLKQLMIKPQIGYILSVLFYGIGIIGSNCIPNVFCIWTACQYVPFFFIGMRIRTKEEKTGKLLIEGVPCLCWIVIDITLFIISILVESYTEPLWSLISFVLKFFLHVVGGIMAWTSLQTLADRVNWQKSKVFNTLSSYSMPMYLFHQQIIYFVIVLLNGKVSPWINAVANFVIALVGSFIISWILMRWKVTRVLVGES